VIVVDCSAVVDALTGLAGTEALRSRLAGDDDLHAPESIDYEIVSALRGLLDRRMITADRAMDVLADFEHLPIERWSADDALRRRALQLRDNLSAYDAAYVALAEALDCALITRDGRLARTTGHDARIEVL
jgi:predicted nucleic acid-binding protein